MLQNKPVLPNQTPLGVPRRRHRARLVKVTAGFVLFALLAVACGTPTLPCGTFTYTGTPSGHYLNVNVDFNFNPATCGAACTCNTICYVQIVRVVDQQTGAFLAPGPEQQNRIVTGQTPTQNGWSVDRLEGRQWGYYGRFDNGTFAGTLTTGSNTTTATLRDGPGGFPPNTWMDFVSIPVCIDANASCNNRLLGYYYWLFFLDSSGNATDPINEIGVTWMQDSFNSAVVEWNADAPGLGKHTLPGMSPLP
jgi:hypothetical protein